MTATLRDRAEHAAKHGKNLFIPASDIVELLDERDRFVLGAGRQLDRANDASAVLDRVGQLHATDTDGNCAHCTRGRLYPILAPCDTAAALTENETNR